jgi:hypothetical protein
MLHYASRSWRANSIGNAWFLQGDDEYGPGGRRVAPWPKQKWGPALLPAPTAPSEGSAGQVVQVPGDLFQKSWLTSSGVASHLTAPSEEETDRLVDCASRRLACPFDYRCLAEPKPSDVPRPFLGRPLLRLALPIRSKAFEPRRARERSTLPAPLPDWPRKSPKSFTLPVGGDRSFRHPPLPSCPCGPSGGGGDFRPDHP